MAGNRPDGFVQNAKSFPPVITFSLNRSAVSRFTYLLFAACSVVTCFLYITTDISLVNEGVLFSSKGDYWVPCAKMKCSHAATLTNSPLQRLKRRKHTDGITTVRDYDQLAGPDTAALQQLYFDIPKVLHQVWLGDKPPYDWINAWR